MSVSIADLPERYRRDGDSLALSRALSIIEATPTRTLEFGGGVERPPVHRTGVTGPVGALIEEAARRWRT